MAKESKKQKFMLVIMSIVAALGGLLFGYDTGVISGAILFIKKDFDLTSFQVAWIISIVALGAIAGALSAGGLTDKFGRKKVILTSSLIFILAAIALAWSPSPTWIIFGRLVVGIAIGVTSATAPLYIAELSPLSIRGALVSLNQLAITIGILLAYVAGLAFSKTHDWRTMFLIAAVPAAIQFIFMCFFPESPRWLVLHKKKKQALEILERYRGSKSDAKLEIDHISKINKQDTGGWNHVLSKKVRAPLMAGITLTIIQQVTGINTIIYFAPTIFQFAGFSSDKAAIFATTLVGIVNVLMTFVAIWLLDRVGRKPLLVTGLGGMVLSLIVLGIGFIFVKDSTVLAWTSVVSMMCYIGFFAYSLGPIAWLINSEIFPLKVRGKAMGIATCFNWGSNFLVTLSFLWFIQHISATGTFWLYAVLGIFGIWFIIKRIPETNHKSLEEIEEFWK